MDHPGTTHRRHHEPVTLLCLTCPLEEINHPVHRTQPGRLLGTSSRAPPGATCQSLAELGRPAGRAAGCGSACWPRELRGGWALERRRACGPPGEGPTCDRGPVLRPAGSRAGTWLQGPGSLAVLSSPLLFPRVRQDCGAISWPLLELCGRRSSRGGNFVTGAQSVAF